jgi:tRNA (guanine37-N1)-methyltransferase
MTFSVTTLTLFPEMFPGALGHSIIGKALQEGKWSLNTLQIRDFATDKHAKVDDLTYGGGAGMLMKPDVISAAITHAQCLMPNARILYMSPRGKLLNQQLVEEFSQQSLIILCGRYEGVDQRVLDYHQVEEISLGDYVLCGGEVAAMALIEACVRLLPGVMGEESSAHEESCATDGDCAGLLEYPQYTKPPVWKGLEVPEVLLSGHHQRIREWRKAQAEALTQRRRPDLWARYQGK